MAGVLERSTQAAAPPAAIGKAATDGQPGGRPAAADVPATLTDLEPYILAVRRRLERVRRQMRSDLRLCGLTELIGLAAALAAASLAADWLLRLSLPVRLVLLLLGLAALAYTAWTRLVQPVRLRLDDLDLAALINTRMPGVGQRLAAVLQLPELITGRELASPAMVRQAVRQHATVLEDIDLLHVLDAPRRWRRRGMLGGVLLAVLVFISMAPAAASIWARRWFLGSNERWPQRTYLAVRGIPPDGIIRAPRGESLLIEVDARPQFTGEPYHWTLDGRDERLLIRQRARPTSEPPAQVHITYQPEGGARRRGNFARFGQDRFRYELPAVLEPTRVFIAGGDDWLGPLRVQPIDRPAIARLEIFAQPPDAKQATRVSAEGSGSQLAFLRKSRLRLRFQSTIPLAHAVLATKQGNPPPLRKLDERRYEARWEMDRPLNLELVLVAADGGLASKPYFLSLGLLEDRPPRVNIRASGVGRLVTSVVRVPLMLSFQDDLGLRAVAWEAEWATPTGDEIKRGARRYDLPLPTTADGAPLTDLELRHTAMLAELALPAGSQVRLRGRAEDNSADGPQSGFSRWLTYQVVTPEELMYEIVRRQRAERDKFKAAVDQQRSIADPLAALVEPEQARPLAARHKLLARQVVQVGRRLDETLQEMINNDLGSAPARELLKRDILEPLADLGNVTLPEVSRRLEGLAARLDDTNLNETRQAHADALAQMERILQRMAQWESFLDVVNQLREVIRLQTGVLQDTEQERASRTRDLFDQ